MCLEPNMLVNVDTKILSHKFRLINIFNKTAIMQMSLTAGNIALFNGPNSINIERMDFDQKHLLKVNACAVCSYDVRVFRNGHKKVKPPVILGHELCGETLDTLNINNTKINPGTRVIVCPIIPCLSCYYCKSKKYNLCSNLKELGSTMNGGFSQYMNLPDHTIKIGGIIPIPHTIINDYAVLLEPLSCCLNGISRLGKISRSDTAIIFGDGPIGLLHLQLLKSKNINVILIGLIEKRMKIAKKLGADLILHFKNDESIIKQIMDFTYGVGASISIIATSNKQAIHSALKVSSKNSKINLFAGLKKEDKLILDLNYIHYNQLSIMGSFSSTPKFLKIAVDMVKNGQISLTELVTRKFDLNEIHDALSYTENCSGLKAVINRFD